MSNWTKYLLESDNKPFAILKNGYVFTENGVVGINDSKMANKLWKENFPEYFPENTNHNPFLCR